MSSAITSNVSGDGGGTVDERLSSILSSSSQFSVASYLNLALQEAANTRDGDALQRRMAELALQLQIQTQSCHEDIGRIGAELQAIMPRCAADVGRVGVGLEGMRIDAASLLSSGNTGSNQEISDSMETLSTLHALQSNLKKTKDVLAAAASWDSTLSSIAPLLSQQNLTEAVAALAKLESGERALRGMPRGKEERQESITKIRSQVQVMLQPQLKHALQNMHTRISPLQQCVSMYTALGKMDSLKQEYINNRPGAIHKLWFAYKAPTMNSYNQSEKDLFDGVEDDPTLKAERDATDPAAAFVSWLPSWYDAVLTLLAEERRQSLAVFGPDLAPEMIASVLGECFRPILSSFESRLKSIYPPDSSASSSSPGSLESICAIYESTLQFLSLSYESVAGSWLDEHQAFSSGTSKEMAKAALDLYNELTTVFLLVGSPFGTYQNRFAELEKVHSGASTDLVAKDIQQAVSTVSQSNESLVGLQDATERLKGLAPFIFQLVEDGLVRFELLNAGYNAPGALSSIDKLLSGHAGELAIAITTLSASLTADQNRLADTFDEQHVHCALEVLKVAGAFRRGLRDFKSKTRERLSVLCERMAAQLAHEKEVQDASSSGGTSSTTGSSFMFPDSLSVVEIDSLLTKAACGDREEQVDETNPSLTTLQRLSNPETERTAALYPEADDSMTKLATSCHTLVFDVCAAVPQRHLNMMSAMSSWREPADTSDFGSYGTLPQEYITHVGEHMLALVQALEPFASDAEALALANEVMNGAHEVAKQPWREFVAAAGSEDASTDEVIESLMKGKDLAEFGILSDFLDEEEEEVEHDEEEEDEAAKASTAFCNKWLDVVGLAVTGRLLERIMRIPHLTPKGCEHLSADLGYLVNVFSALGVSGHPHPLLNYFGELAMMDSEVLKEKIMSRDKTQPVAVAIRATEVRIALMRGIAVN